MLNFGKQYAALQPTDNTQVITRRREFTKTGLVL